MSDFWAKEAEWQQEQLSQAFPVTVCNPDTVAGGMFSKSFTTYEVRIVESENGVRRRFSDFVWLREVLVARFHGIAVPLLPEKRVMGNTDESFILERMSGLQLWCRQVAANPYLRNDTTFKVFLETPAGSEFEQAKRAAQQGAGSNPTQNTGLAQWFGCLRNYSVPDGADAAIGELRALTEEAEQHAVGTLQAATQLHDAAKTMSAAIEHLEGSFKRWGEKMDSRSAGMSDKNQLVRERTGQLGVLLGRTADAMHSAHDLSKFAPNEISMFIMNCLVFEVQRIRAFKGLLSVHAAAIDAHSRAFQAQDRLEFQERQMRGKGREDQAAQLQPRISSAQAETRAMKERLDDVAKGILHVESKNISIVRLDKLRDCVAMYATLNVDSGGKARELWESFLTNIDVSAGDAVENAHQVLTGDVSVSSYRWSLASAPDAEPTQGAAPAAGAGGGAAGGGGVADAPPADEDEDEEHLQE